MKRTYTVTLDDDTALALAGLCARHGFEPEAIIASEIAANLAQIGNELDGGEYERHIVEWMPDFIATHPCAAMVPTLSMKQFAALKVVADLAYVTPSHILEDCLKGIVENWTDESGYGEETIEHWIANEFYDLSVVPLAAARAMQLRNAPSEDRRRYPQMAEDLAAKLEAGDRGADTAGIIEKPLRNYLLALDPREISDNDLLRAVAHRLASKAA